MRRLDACKDVIDLRRVADVGHSTGECLPRLGQGGLGRPQGLRSLSMPTTAHPSPTRASAIARPIPRAAPVTTARREESGRETVITLVLSLAGIADVRQRLNQRVSQTWRVTRAVTMATVAGSRLSQVGGRWLV